MSGWDFSCDFQDILCKREYDNNKFASQLKCQRSSSDRFEGQEAHYWCTCVTASMDIRAKWLLAHPIARKTDGQQTNTRECIAGSCSWESSREWWLCQSNLQSTLYTWSWLFWSRAQGMACAKLCASFHTYSPRTLLSIYRAHNDLHPRK